MGPLYLSTLVLVGGALVLALIAAAPALWRRFKSRKKDRPHD